MRVLPKIKEEDIIVKLDNKDKILLRYLVKNIRLPITRLAKLCKIGRETVNYRVDNLKKNRVIVGAITAIAMRKIGFYSYHLFLEIPDFTEINKNKIIKILDEIKGINAIITYSGKLNVEVGVLVRDVHELKGILDTICSKIDIKDHRVLILTDTIKSDILPGSFFKNLELKGEFGKDDTSFHKEFLRRKPNAEIKLDEKDYELLKNISKNALFKIRDLSKRINLAEKTTINRIKDLIKKGVIIDFRPIINYYTLDYSVQTVLIRLNNKGFKNLEEINKTLIKEDNIIWGVRCIGGWDILLYVLSKDLKEFHDFINKFKNKFGDCIKSYETLLAYEEYKYLFYPE